MDFVRHKYVFIYNEKVLLIFEIIQINSMKYLEVSTNFLEDFRKFQE